MIAKQNCSEFINDIEDCHPYMLIDVRRTFISDIYTFLINWLQFLFLLVLLAMIACAVYQVLISLLKTIVLLTGMCGYLIVYFSHIQDVRSISRLMCLVNYR